MEHILMDFGVGLFPMRGTLTLAEAATLLLVSFIHVWWCLSVGAGAQGNGGGIASAAILGLGWTALTNGYPIVHCMPLCPFAAPLGDAGHVGSINLRHCGASSCDLDAVAGAETGAVKLAVTHRCVAARGCDGGGAGQLGS